MVQQRGAYSDADVVSTLGQYTDADVHTSEPPSPLRAVDANDPSLVKDYGPSQYLGYLAQRFSDPLVNIPRDWWKGMKNSPDPTKQTTTENLSILGGAATGMLKGLVAPPWHLAKAALSGNAGDAAQAAGEAMPLIAGSALGESELPDTANPLGSKIITDNITAPGINRVLNIPTRLRSANIDPGAQLIQDKFVGTLKGAKAHMEQAQAAIGPSIENKLSMDNPGARIDVGAIVDANTAEASKQLLAGSEPAFQARLTNIQDAIKAKFPNLNSMSPLDAQRFKSFIGTNVNWNEGLAVHETGLNDMLHGIYSDTKNAIGEAVPSVRPELAKWGNYEVGVRAAEAALERARFGQTSLAFPSLRRNTWGSMPAQTVTGRLFRVGAPPTPPRQWADTMARGQSAPWLGGSQLNKATLLNQAGEELSPQNPNAPGALLPPMEDSLSRLKANLMQDQVATKAKQKLPTTGKPRSYEDYFPPKPPKQMR